MMLAIQGPSICIATRPSTSSWRTSSAIEVERRQALRYDLLPAAQALDHRRAVERGLAILGPRPPASSTKFRISCIGWCRPPRLMPTPKTFGCPSPSVSRVAAFGGGEVAVPVGRHLLDARLLQELLVVGEDVAGIEQVDAVGLLVPDADVLSGPALQVEPGLLDVGVERLEPAFVGERLVLEGREVDDSGGVPPANMVNIVSAKSSRATLVISTVTPSCSPRTSRSPPPPRAVGRVVLLPG